MALEIDKEAIFPSSGPYHSQQHYPSCLLWLKPLKHSSYYMKHQLEHIKTLHFPTECIYVYHMILKINSHYFTKKN